MDNKEKRPYKGFPNVETYIEDLMARITAFNEEHAVYLQQTAERIASGELDPTEQPDPQHIIEIDKVMKSWDNPEDKAKLKKIGLGNNVARLRYGLEVHNQSMAFKKELQDAQIQLMKQQQEHLEPIIQTMKAYIEGGQKKLAQEGPDAKIEAAILVWQEQLEEFIQNYKSYEMRIAVLSPFLQN